MIKYFIESRPCCCRSVTTPTWSITHAIKTPHAAEHTNVAFRCFCYLSAADQDVEAVFDNQDSAKTLIHALIASRLDYCNSMLYQINVNATKTLQSVLHSAARLVMRKRRFDSITPTLRDDLHWLPVPQRIVYKLWIIIYRWLHQTALQSTFKSCACQSQPLPVAVICTQLFLVIYKLRQQELSLSGLTVSQLHTTVCKKNKNRQAK